jgi:pimeloyl-ACP methyl ester carboxylesterase
MSERIEIDGHVCVYDIAGSGPALTLLHSVGLSTREGWRYQIDALAARYRLLTFDFRGLGESTRGEGPLGADRFANDLKLLLGALGIDKTALMGVSLGGFVAQKFALSDLSMVSALVLVSTAPKIFAGYAKRRADRNDKIRASGMSAAAGHQIESHFPEDFLAANPDVIEWYRQHYLANNVDAYIEIMEDLGRFDTTHDLRRISCPTLIVAGEADHSSVAGSAPLESARMLHAAIAGSQLVTIPGAFHYPHIDHAHQFNAAAMRFLQAHVG